MYCISFSILGILTSVLASILLAGSVEKPWNALTTLSTLHTLLPPSEYLSHTLFHPSPLLKISISPPQNIYITPLPPSEYLYHPLLSPLRISISPLSPLRISIAPPLLPPQNIYITGGGSLFPNFAERLTEDVRQMRPFGSSFSILSAEEKLLDGWRGASVWGRAEGSRGAFVTRGEYEERGGEFLRESGVSNVYVTRQASS